MKLSAKQNELLDYIKSGGVVHHIDGIKPYWFRSDNHKTVSGTVMALSAMGVIKIVGKYDLKIHLNDIPRPPPQALPHTLY